MHGLWCLYRILRGQSGRSWENCEEKANSRLAWSAGTQQYLGIEILYRSKLFQNIKFNPTNVCACGHTHHLKHFIWINRGRRRQLFPFSTIWEIEFPCNPQNLHSRNLSLSFFSEEWFEKGKPKWTTYLLINSAFKTLFHPYKEDNYVNLWNCASNNKSWTLILAFQCIFLNFSKHWKWNLQ